MTSSNLDKAMDCMKDRKATAKSSRITMEDDVETSMVKLMEGNPGAMNVLMSLFEATPRIDPLAAFKGIHYFLFLDDMGIYGSNIWLLFKDVCGRGSTDMPDNNIRNMIALLRASQLGIVPRSSIFTAIENASNGRPSGDHPFNFKEIIEDIRKKIGKFAEDETNSKV